MPGSSRPKHHKKIKHVSMDGIECLDLGADVKKKGKNDAAVAWASKDSNSREKGKPWMRSRDGKDPSFHGNGYASEERVSSRSRGDRVDEAVSDRRSGGGDGLAGDAAVDKVAEGERIRHFGSEKRSKAKGSVDSKSESHSRNEGSSEKLDTVNGKGERKLKKMELKGVLEKDLDHHETLQHKKSKGLVDEAVSDWWCGGRDKHIDDVSVGKVAEGECVRHIGSEKHSKAKGSVDSKSKSNRRHVGNGEKLSTVSGKGERKRKKRDAKGKLGQDSDHHEALRHDKSKEKEIGSKKDRKIEGVKHGKDLPGGEPGTDTREETSYCPGKSKAKSNKRVNFSDNVEFFEKDGKVNYEGDGLVRGKRFSKEEDEMVQTAVLTYIEEHGLGEEGLGKVLNCVSHPELRHCWKEISAALPWRPSESVYYRAHNLFERAEKRSWSVEEIQMLRKHYEKHGPEWKPLAVQMGKHRFHVKDTWRRIKLPNLNHGKWTQEEFQKLFDLVNMDLRMKALGSEHKRYKHGMLRDNICWEAISEKLETRIIASCCDKWYNQLSSPMVAQGFWADSDDYRLLGALYNLDACCYEDVEWDELVENRPGDLCRKRWHQMVRHIGDYRNRSFAEQVEVLSERYCPELLESRVAYDSRPILP